MKESTGARPMVKWAIVALACVATALSLWLTVQKLTGKINSLAGCGGEGGCSDVLGSKWSMVMGVVPVSVFSCLLYMAVIVSLWVGGIKVRWFRMLAAWMFIGAAVWFTALQLFVLDTICRYCMTMHGVGVLLGVLILWVESKAEGARIRAIGSLFLAVVMVSGLALVQHYGPEPETHRVDEVSMGHSVGRGKGGSKGEGLGEVDTRSAGDGRIISFFEGKKNYRLEELPYLGSKDAKHVIVKYFDYTCDACFKVHGDLEKIAAKYPNQLTVIVLPAPLNRRCNPNLPTGVKDHVNACEFAKLALRVWRADPSQFAEFHNWLFEYHEQPYGAAEAMAYSLIAAEKMDAVDPAWIDAVLQANVADYKKFSSSSPVMPKVLLKGSKIMQGSAKDLETFELLLRENLGLGNE